MSYGQILWQPQRTHGCFRSSLEVLIIHSRYRILYVHPHIWPYAILRADSSSHDTLHLASTSHGARLGFCEALGSQQANARSQGDVEVRGSYWVAAKELHLSYHIAVWIYMGVSRNWVSLLWMPHAPITRALLFWVRVRCPFLLEPPM